MFSDTFELIGSPSRNIDYKKNVIILDGDYNSEIISGKVKLKIYSENEVINFFPIKGKIWMY